MITLLGKSGLATLLFVCLWHVSYDLFALPLGVIGWLCSVIVFFFSGHLLFCFFFFFFCVKSTNSIYPRGYSRNVRITKKSLPKVPKEVEIKYIYNKKTNARYETADARTRKHEQGKIFITIICKAHFIECILFRMYIVSV